MRSSETNRLRYCGAAMQEHAMPQSGTESNEFADRLIEALLTGLLDRAHGSSFACLNLVNPQDSCAVVPVPCNSVGGVFKATAMAGLMQSLLDWQTVLPSLRNGDCLLVRVSPDRAQPLRRRLWWAGVSSLLVCPVAGPAGGLMGIMLTVWHGDDPGADAAPMIELKAAAQRTGRQIAAVLDLCKQAFGQTEHSAVA